MNSSKKEISPTTYFESIKEKRNLNTDEDLDKFYESSLLLLDKYRRTNQIEMIKKLLFIIDCVPKEHELIKHGINLFIYRDDIEEYINEVKDKVVKIIEVEKYPREIPDELVLVIEETKTIFDRFYILFTDYTGKIERKVEKERRDKDPILFGVFKKGNQMNDRFYYLGDWIDEYCDLTLEKLVKIRSGKIVKPLHTPINKDELMEECSRLVKNKKSNVATSWVIQNDDNLISFEDGKPTITKKKPKRRLFSKVVSVLKRT